MARFNRSRSPEQDRLECKANLKEIATAAEMYSLDNAQRLPDSLRGLEGSYLKKLPTCPTTGSDYSESYRVVTSPDTYSFGFLGRHHGEPRPGAELHGGDYSLGYPWLDAENGLSDHP